MKGQFEKRNIIIVGEEFKSKIRENNKDIKEQIDHIIEFQEIMGEYKDNFFPRISSTLGKELQNYIIQYKKLKDEIDIISGKCYLNKLDRFLLENERQILIIAEKSLNKVVSNNYREILIRAMNKFEVCLGKSDENNLRKTAEGIYEVGTLKYFSYNMKEIDFYNYYKKLIRRGINFDQYDLIQYFVENSKLTSSSAMILEGLSEFPTETMRAIEKYRRGKRGITEEDCIKIIEKYKELKL